MCGAMEVAISVLLLMTQSALATFVLVRAQERRPAWLFFGLTIIFSLLNSQGLFPLIFTNPAQSYDVRVFHGILLGVFSLTILWLLSQIFMPQWWQSLRTIGWISLPYIIIISIVAVDLIGRFGWFVNGLDPVTGLLRLAVPFGFILPLVFTVGWFVILGMLGFAFFQRQEWRQSITFLILSILFTLIVTQINLLFKFIPMQLTSLVTSFPILGTLAYIVLRTSLLVPTRAALDLALQAMDDMLVVLDQQRKIVYANAQARQLGLQVDSLFVPQAQRLPAEPQLTGQLLQSLDQGSQNTIAMTINGKRLNVTVNPVVDWRNEQRGILIVGRDVTALEQRTADLELRNAEQQRLLELVATLETPMIALAEGVLLAPIVGALDSRRAQTLTTRLLQEVGVRRTRQVVLDIAGVTIVDTQVAKALLQSAQALRLLGCTVTITGISSIVATTLTHLGIALDGIEIARSPQAVLLRIVKAGRL